VAVADRVAEGEPKVMNVLERSPTGEPLHRDYDVMSGTFRGFGFWFDLGFEEGCGLDRGDAGKFGFSSLVGSETAKGEGEEGEEREEEEDGEGEASHVWLV